MAITRGNLWNASASFVDRDNNRSTFGWFLDGALTDADAYTAALAIATAAQTISNAALYALHLGITSFDPAVDVSAVVEASDVERKGVFTFQAADPKLQVRMEVPSIRNELVIDGSNTLNAADAGVAAFIAAVLAGGLGAGNGPVHISGADLATRKGYPYKMHRGSSKG